MIDPMRHLAPRALALIAAVTFLGACSGSSDDEVRVPSLRGMAVQDASTTLTAKGLAVQVSQPSVQSGEDQSCTVSDQSPAADSRVEAGTTVDLTVTCATVSQGKEPEAAESTPAPAPEQVGAASVEAAFASSYGWPEDSHWSAIESFSDRDYPRITVVTTLYDKVENAEEATGICNAVASVLAEDWTGVYVTAGEGGPFLAECARP